ncbi:MAG: hypothetical protein EOO73_34590 [Myxococcales bacterium]|nr:MAG: hypothetical protein EOO73_34590 [Myxococcales bacterium]
MGHVLGSAFCLVGALAALGCLGSSEEEACDAAYSPDAPPALGRCAPNVVTLSVKEVDDFVYLTVGGVRRRVFSSGPDVEEDVSEWFAKGTNTLRIQAANTLGPASYSVQLRVDGQLVVDESCASAPCANDVAQGGGILFDRQYEVATPRRPPPQTLAVGGTTGGKLYLNDAFTGLSLPAILTLPQGSYTVGVGVGEGSEGEYTGRYFEERVLVGASPATVTPTSSPALSRPNRTRVAILPIRTTYHGDETPENTGLLLDSDIAVMSSQAAATRDRLLEPFSYELTTWDITVLPTEEAVPLHRSADPASSPDTDRFLTEAGLTSVLASYDSVIFLYSRFRATGDGVVHGPCCFWGGGQQILFMNQMTRGGWPADFPNQYLLHEALHDYESYNDARLHFYNGADGLHGNEEHGYHGGEGTEAGLLQWQRRFIRGQVAEVGSMRAGSSFTDSPPVTGDLWVGVFDTMRRGVSWAHPGSLRAVRAPQATMTPLRSTPAPASP